MKKIEELLDQAVKEINACNYDVSHHLLLQCKEVNPEVILTYFLLNRLNFISGYYSINNPIEAKANIKIIENIVNKIENDKNDFLIQFYIGGYNAFISKNAIIEGKIFINGKVIIQNSYLQPNVYLGNNTYIGHMSFIGMNVICGSYCSIAMNSTIGAGEHQKEWLTTSNFAHNFFPPDNIKNTNLMIGNDCWIGANTFIRHGIKIGDGSIIGAGSVVLKDTPPYSISIGNPSKVIKYRFNQNIIERLIKLKWWKLPEIYLKNIQFNSIENALFQLEDINPDYYCLD
jgi:virginiamycin A acetyltransferase